MGRWPLVVEVYFLESVGTHVSLSLSPARRFRGPSWPGPREAGSRRVGLGLPEEGLPWKEAREEFPRDEEPGAPAGLSDFPHWSSPGEGWSAPLLQVSSRPPPPPESLLGGLRLVPTAPSSTWGGATSTRGVCTFKSGTKKRWKSRRFQGRFLHSAPGLPSCLPTWPHLSRFGLFF